MRQIVKKYIASLTLVTLIFGLLPHHIVAAGNDDVIYPLKQISKLECRFQEFDTLSRDCKESLPILKSKDYEKYAKKNGGYNDFTRLYTVLWGSSYKYGWDVGNGGHQGTDIATAKGTPVYSIANGKVINVGNDIGWGKFVSIEHNIRGKKIISNYAHLSKIRVDTGDRVDVGDKIGEVGSTGNSTGNHLHFQIDLPNTFHPYYYDWNTCPHSYYEITEKGVCFDELDRHTIDPLVFLETSGAVLDEVEIIQSSTKKSSSSEKTRTVKTSDIEDVLETTIYYGYGTAGDVKGLQKLMKRLDYYDGKYTGEFKDVEKAVLEFQLDTGVLESKNDEGAGWFGPKTRAQAKIEYGAYLADRRVGFEEDEKREDAAAEVEVREEVTRGDNEVVVKKNTSVKKVSRENLMTREEREAQEMAEFLKIYDIEIENGVSQLKVGTTNTSLLSIADSRGKNFRGNTPGTVTFEYNSDIVSIFPNSFFNFRGEPREIQITGKKSGHTTLNIKIGEVIVKTLSISVGTQGEVPEARSATIYGEKRVVLGEEHTGIVLLTDQYSNKLVRAKYSGRFELSSGDNILYCIKRGRLQDINEIYKRTCFPEEYSSNIEFDYSDTIEGLLIFDYKVLDSAGEIQITKVGGNKMGKHSLSVLQPKNLEQNYVYYDEVIAGLMSGVIDGVDRGFFQQDKELSAQDAKKWILAAMDEAEYSDAAQQDLRNTPVNRFRKLSRGEFLDMTYEYMGGAGGNGYLREYKDMEVKEQAKVASLLGADYAWKDNFGERYFQAEKRITRGEAAYMLHQVLEQKNNGFLASR